MKKNSRAYSIQKRRTLGVLFFSLCQMILPQNSWSQEGRRVPAMVLAGLRSYEDQDRSSGKKWEREFVSVVSQELKNSDRVIVIPGETANRYIDKILLEEQVNARQKIKEADQRLKEGRALYENLSIQDALTALSEAVNGYREGISVLTNNEKMLEAHLFLGMALIVSGRGALGRKTIRDKIVFDPLRFSRSLSAREFPPKIVRLHEELTEEIQAEPKGSVVIRTEPIGARIFLDGVSQNPSPLDILHVPLGEHFIVIEKAGYRTISKRFEVKAGENRLDFSLEPFAPFDPVVFADRRDPVKQESMRLVGRELGADIVVLARFEDKSDVEALAEFQLYDIRSKEFSRIESMFFQKEHADRAGKKMADAVFRNITSGGLVVAQIGPEELKKFQSNAGPEKIYRTEKDVPYYKKWWFWPAVGGVVALGLGVGLLLSTQSNGGKQIFRIQNPLPGS